MVINAQNITSACVLLWAIAFYCITTKPVACALGYGFIQAILMVFVHERRGGGPVEYALLEVGLMATFILALFLLLDRISNHQRMWKLALVAGTAIAMAGNFVLVPQLDDYLSRKADREAVAIAGDGGWINAPTAAKGENPAALPSRPC